MRSFSIGKIMGISMELHSTFVWLITAVVILLALFDPSNFIPIMILLFFLFFSVFIHELFHSMVAVSKGVKVDRIILTPIGGISVAEEFPEKGLTEFLIAIAGPFFNFAVVAIILLLVNLFPILPWPHFLFNGLGVNWNLFDQAVLQFPLFGLFWVNLILGAFNLFVPALPMDGGRVLRSLLAMRMGFARATSAASQISKAIAVLMFLIGFFVPGFWILIFVAVFVYFGAISEGEVAIVKETLKGIDLASTVKKNPLVVEGNANLNEVYGKMVETNRIGFLVQADYGFGFINADMLEKVPRERWALVEAGAVAKQVPEVDVRDNAGRVMVLMMSKGHPILPVMDQGVLVGVVTETELAKLYRLRKLEQARQHAEKREKKAGQAEGQPE